MIKIGLVGCGHLGNIHLRLLKEIPAFELVGVYDVDTNKAQTAAEQYNTQTFESLSALLESVEAVDIVTPTLTHFAIAKQALQNSCHIFVEKPLANTVEEARTLMDLAAEARVTAQVGHIERFNPAFVALQQQGFQLSPMFIECHRLAQWNPRGTDVSVILDLMIHDIDIILNIIRSPVRKVSANAVAVVSDTPDIANARIDFHSGCVANLTASRISLKNMRKMRMFQKNAYVSIDFLDKKTEIYHIQDQAPEVPAWTFDFDNRKKYLSVEIPTIPELNALKTELMEFANAIQNRTEPKVSIYDGYVALLTAHQIIEKLNTY